MTTHRYPRIMNAEVDLLAQDIYRILNDQDTLIKKLSSDLASSASGGYIDVFDGVFEINPAMFSGIRTVMTVPAGYMLQYFILVINTAFNVGQMSISVGGATEIPSTEILLTSTDGRSEYPIFKQYASGGLITATFTGSPAVGDAKLLTKIRSI